MESVFRRWPRDSRMVDDAEDDAVSVKEEAAAEAEVEVAVIRDEDEIEEGEVGEQQEAPNVGTDVLESRGSTLRRDDFAVSRER